MKFNAECWKRRLAALAIGMSWLTGCATVGSEASRLVACPPVVGYSRALQARAAEELALLPGHSTIAEMLMDYVVMREQVRACGDL